MNIKIKNIMVTGATGGLGKAVVKLFLKEKANVIITYFNKNSYHKLRDELGNPKNLSAYQVDLSDPEKVEQLFDNIFLQYSHLDDFIHLAGAFWMGGTIADTPVSAWNNMIEQNLNATFYACRKAFQMMKQQGGHILTIAAKPALELPANMGAYAVSKAGVLALSEILSKEGTLFDIRANCILPGIIDTPGNRKAMPDADYSNWVSSEEIALDILSLVNSSVSSGSIIKMFGKI